jgi:hypothetical protein
MTKKSKTKKSVSKPATKVVRAKKYESHYLAIALIAFLLLEGIFITSTQAVDWQKGVTVLDISSSVSQTMSDLEVTLQPVIETASNVNQFYQIAATQMMWLLDLSSNNPIDQVAQVTNGVTEFYNQATIELAYLFDMSSAGSWVGNVSGASVSSY